MLRTAAGVGGRFPSGNAALRAPAVLRTALRFARLPASAEGVQAATPRRGGGSIGFADGGGDASPCNQLLRLPASVERFSSGNAAL